MLTDWLWLLLALVSVETVDWPMDHPDYRPICGPSLGDCKIRS